MNYGGHLNRVFRVEFSPSDPDLMYSFADENSVHVWHPSEQTAKTPAERSSGYLVICSIVHVVIFTQVWYKLWFIV